MPAPRWRGWPGGGHQRPVQGVKREFPHCHGGCGIVLLQRALCLHAQVSLSQRCQSSCTTTNRRPTSRLHRAEVVVGAPTFVWLPMQNRLPSHGTRTWPAHGGKAGANSLAESASSSWSGADPAEAFECATSCHVRVSKFRTQTSFRYLPPMNPRANPQDAALCFSHKLRKEANRPAATGTAPHLPPTTKSRVSTAATACSYRGGGRLPAASSGSDQVPAATTRCLIPVPVLLPPSPGISSFSCDSRWSAAAASTRLHQSACVKEPEKEDLESASTLAGA